MHVKIVTYRNHLVFNTLDEKAVQVSDASAPIPFVFVIDTENNLGISAEAIDMLKKAPVAEDRPPVFDWFQPSEDEYPVFGWMGSVHCVRKLNALYRPSSFLVPLGHKLIDNEKELDPEARAFIDQIIDNPNAHQDRILTIGLPMLAKIILKGVEEHAYTTPSDTIH